jgi:hypothetical protein
MTATGSGREGFADMALLVRAFQVSKMLAVAASLELRIPMKPDAYSKVKPDIYSVFIPDSVPI